MLKRSFAIVFLANIIFFHLNFAFAQIIEDDIAMQAFKGQNLSKPVYKKEIIEDDAVRDFKGKKLTKPTCKKILIEDKVFVDIKTCSKKAVHYKLIDENAEIVKIPVCAINLITTKDGLKNGQKVEFKVSKDVYKNGKIFIQKDTPVNAIIELISKAERYGDPDEIELGRLSTKDVHGNSINLDGTIRKQGADRGKWVKPLYYAAVNMPYPCLPLIVFYFVKGGQTQIKPEQKFELYYE